MKAQQPALQVLFPPKELKSLTFSVEMVYKLVVFFGASTLVSLVMHVLSLVFEKNYLS